ncbi:peptide deformylase [Aristophania vespae]|uniref:Peptide deformylase n=1 Tax=Aristophania vespae TaxID=2697033 RepID=A0A6P1NCY9_9PROT|nr:peptide deformylase [Aristophania vespae]QHI95353.1 peptide deformylase [Aristophania vespae]UMM64622.1 Peptide deformylase [Aristophania vespae]
MSTFKFLEDIDQIAPMPILVAPHPVLKQVASEVPKEDLEKIRSLLPGMFSAMYKAPGIGLAAPQVGISQRFFIMDISEKDAPPEPMVLINPEIVKESEEFSVHEEGCLSLPNQFAEVERPESIVVNYIDQDGKPVNLKASGLLATCIQHELDHLDGILFVDHLSSLKRNMVLRKLAKEQKRKR